MAVQNRKGMREGIPEHESPKESRKHTVTTAMMIFRFAIVISKEKKIKEAEKKNLTGKCLKERHSCAANTVWQGNEASRGRRSCGFSCLW